MLYGYAMMASWDWSIMAKAKPTVEQVLEVYAQEGATAAAEYGQVSSRTVQRWASLEGIVSGWVPPITQGHGTSACYMRGCREQECVEAHRETQRKLKARRVKRLKQGKVTVKHGVSAYSNWNCRCEVCRAAWAAYLRERKRVRSEQA